MKAVVFHGVGDIRLEDVPEPKIKEPTDAIVRLTASAICGTDLHMVRGTMPQMRSGTVLGHEGVGIVEEIGKDVRNLKAGDRVVIPSTIACGICVYCRAGYYSHCDVANPNGPQAGTAFFGGPASTGPFHGLQAERARVPFANVGLVKLPSEITDEQALLMSDIFPTGYFGADCAQIKPGNSVVVFGCGPVGLFTIVSARLMHAGRIFAVDCIDTRLEMARNLGAEVIDFGKEDPVKALQELTRGTGVDRAIDAVGVDAVSPPKGDGKRSSQKHKEEFQQELKVVAPKTRPDGDNWSPGDAPSQVLLWALESLSKAGTLSIIGVYSDTAKLFPIGQAMNKNLTIAGGNCPHRKYIPKLIEYVQSGVVDPSTILTNVETLANAIDAYKAFDTRQPGWVKVELRPDRLAA